MNNMKDKIAEVIWDSIQVAIQKHPRLRNRDELEEILSELEIDNTASPRILDLIAKELPVDDLYKQSKKIKLEIANHCGLDMAFFAYQEGKMSKRKLCSLIADWLAERQYDSLKDIKHKLGVE